jgi:hypothetical protein
MARNPARVRIGERQDRKLDECGAIDQSAERAKLQRMNDVLGVVKDDGFDLALVGLLISQSRVVKMVEAIGLRRRPIHRDLDRLNSASITLRIAAAVAGSLR